MTTEIHSGPLWAPRAVLSLVGVLVAIYIVSQFLRSSVAVIAPDLAAELGLAAVEIGLLSSAYFLAFAAVQLPLGIAIDRFGPRACLLACACVTIVGSILFATATSTAGLIAARVLLGIGTCASLMGPLAIYARRFPPERFATLTGMQIGFGSIGGLLATAPLAFAAAMIGWRGSFLAVAAVTAVIALLVAVVVTDEPRQAGPSQRARDAEGKHRRPVRAVPYPVIRPPVPAQSRELFELRTGGRAVGRTVSGARLWLRPHWPRRDPVPRRGRADLRLARLGADGPGVRQPQGAGASGIGFEHCGTRRHRAVRHARLLLC